jgi:hypothetical protein
MRWRKRIKVICPTRKAEYFFKRDWTTQIALKSLEEKLYSRGAGADLFRRFVALFSISLIAITGSRLGPGFYPIFGAALRWVASQTLLRDVDRPAHAARRALLGRRLDRRSPGIA